MLDGREQRSGVGECGCMGMDTGIGLPREDLEHVFERFYRADRSRSRAHGEWGVGLAIAKALVESMGGRIWAGSPGPGPGATFSFILPIA